MNTNPNNALSKFSSLPQFVDFKAEDVKPAITYLVKQAEESIEYVLKKDERDWSNSVEPIMIAVDRLKRAWGQAGHLNSVISSEKLRAAYNDLVPEVSEFYSKLSQNKKIFQRFKDVAANSHLMGAQREKYLKNELRDYELGGVGLNESEQKIYQDLAKKLASLSAQFSDNVLDATDDYSLNIQDSEKITGLSVALLDDAKARAVLDGKEGWSFTLKAPCWVPFMESCANRDFRQEMYRAYVTRASDCGKSEYDNSQTILQILVARREKAKLLGFESFAHLSFATKMAEKPQEALNLLKQLSQSARARAESEVTMLKTYALDKLGIEELMPWDVSFVAQRIKEERYSFKDEDLRQHFPLSKVISGLFELLNRLYSISVSEEPAETWDPSVKLFSVNNQEGELIGYFYADLFARDGKRPGAWMDDAIGRWKTDQHVQLPVAYLVCNFPSPSGHSGDAFLSHSEVETLFHECGHVMHHLMTQIDEIGISGINGVEWDAVELPSQFMENFCWDWDIVSKISIDTSGEGHIPKPLFEKMVEAKNFMSGIQTLRQVEFAEFDLRIHLSEAPNDIDQVLETLSSIRQEISVIDVPQYNRFPHSFSHIFAGGYAAGYYSYKWAEVLSADAFSMTEDGGMSLSDIGSMFLNEVIGKGGLRSSLKNFVKFRGREPKIDALLRHTGLTKI